MPSPSRFNRHGYQDSEFRVHLVKPQPRDRVLGIHVIVEFIKQEEPHDSIVPSLDETIVWSAFGQSDIERHALYHQRRLRHADIVSSFRDLCHRAQFTCVARVLGRILRPSWTREIEPGAFVQLHVFPPRLHEPEEFTDYIYGLPSFHADSLELMNEAFLPTLFWRMHLLIGEGYQGVAESEIPITSFASASAMADRAFDHWHLQLPAALSMQAYIDQEKLTMLYNISSPLIRRLRESHVLLKRVSMKSFWSQPLHQLLPTHQSFAQLML